MMALPYNLRLQANWATVAALAFPVVLAFGLNLESAGMQFAETFWPVSAPLLMAGLFSREWESGTAETLLARPVNRAGLLVGRVTSAAGLLLLACLLGWGAYWAMGARLPLVNALATTLPGCVALGTVGLASGTVTRSSPAGYLTPLAWWLLDWTTGGSLTGRFYLFGGLTAGKWWLIGVSAAAACLTYLLLLRRD